MLSFLQIRNFAIIDSLDLEFSGGFTCITGETGAGKSVLVGALGLLCGNRADTSSIREGASRAELTAEFDVSDEGAALAWLREAELDDGQNCLLRRVISDTGRSRGWINGTAVTLQQLASLGSLLVEIHGQNEHIRLVRSEEQFRLLDSGDEHGGELDALAAAFGTWSALNQERQALMAETPLDPGELDLLQYQINELETSMISGQEFLDLEAEHRKLARGGELAQAVEGAMQNLESEPEGANATIHRALGQLETLEELDTDIASAATLLREAAINCSEALAGLQAARARLDLSPRRLAEVESQLSAQHDLARKHRCQPEQLQATLNSLNERYSKAGSQEKRLAEIDQRLAEALTQYREAATRLHACRSSRAAELSEGVTELMQQLGMEGGVFEFRVDLDQEAAPSPRGDDRLELRVSANPGLPPGPLRKVASGGELSRISLAIKVTARSGARSATQIFDEVDAGIGGETASAVGALIQGLSGNGQALCVTHLAQVAVFANQQVQVFKSSGNQETRVETTLLQHGERIDEIARMLGGRLSEQSRAHAEELLNTAGTRH